MSPQARLEHVMFWLDRGVISKTSAEYLLAPDHALVSQYGFTSTAQKFGVTGTLKFANGSKINIVCSDEVPEGVVTAVNHRPTTAEEVKPDARCPRCDRSTAPEHMVLFCEQRKGIYGETEVVNGYKCKCWHCEHTWEVM